MYAQASQYRNTNGGLEMIGTPPVVVFGVLETEDAKFRIRSKHQRHGRAWTDTIRYSLFRCNNRYFPSTPLLRQHALTKSCLHLKSDKQLITAKGSAYGETSTFPVRPCLKHTATQKQKRDKSKSPELPSTEQGQRPLLVLGRDTCSDGLFSSRTGRRPKAHATDCLVRKREIGCS